MIRAARPADVAALQQIEVAAGRAFRDVDMAAVASDDSPSEEAFLAWIGAGRAWVVGDAPLAFLVADVLDGRTHVAQVSVHPDAAGRRLGAALVDEAARHAAGRGDDAITLTTFRDVAWNRPYYLRLGFHDLDDLGPELRAVHEHERALFSRWPRVAMIRPLLSAHPR